MRTTVLVIVLTAVLAACQTAQDEPAPAASTRQAGDGEMCGGIAGIRCAEGSYCAIEVGQCRTADVSGICKKITMMCTKEYAPVCGCDGKTYGNACEAGAAGASVLSTGECPK